jgi:[acyl-carrier-protein] S-malonyltransferase
MAKAAAATATGMTAVLGGDEAEVLARIRACGLTAANINGPGQIVAGGTTAELAAFAAEPPAGARLRPLQVAGAFHTPYMAAAAEALRAAAATVAPRNPVLALLSNHDGRVVRGGQDWLSRIVAQVDTPVRWDKCMRAMAALGVTAMIELPPAGTLTGLARRALPGVRVLALKSPADLVHAQEMLAADPAGPADDAHAPEWRLLVAPLGGTFRACERNDVTGAAIGTGAELGHVEIRGDTQPISCAFPATIVEWLVEDGDLVTAGQPIVRLQPQASADTPR